MPKIILEIRFLIEEEANLLVRVNLNLCLYGGPSF